MQYSPCFYAHRIKALLAVCLLLALALTSCSSAAPPASALVPAQARVQLSWIHTIEWAGFYAAEEYGYYTDQALTVDLLAGGEDAQGNYIDPIQTVLDGRADFGVVGGAHLIQARANQAPLVAIASIYQRHPLGFTSLAEKQIATPQDLVGKTVQIAPDSRLLLEAMLTATGVDISQITIEDRTDFSIAPLVNGDADVIDSFITNEAVSLKLAGHKINNILPVDYGVEEYPNVIFTTEQMIAEHPDVVERFLRATLRGMDSAIANPQQVGQLAVRHDSSLDLAKETEAMFQSVPLLKPTGSQPGMMTAKTWQATYQILHDQGILKQPLDVKTVYTLAFLDKIYNK
ncbi:MAG TPA: ABC transporter substrate-binding protein [Herpetosiphonaceae bacterium]